MNMKEELQCIERRYNRLPKLPITQIVRKALTLPDGSFHLEKLKVSIY